MKNKNESLFLRFLYQTALGRLILKPLISVKLSKLCGRFLDCKLSKPLIKKFVKKNNIDLSLYESDDFTCFNDCFCRKLKSEHMKFDPSPNVFISPCDGLLSAYNISDDTVIPVKQSRYTVTSLLKDIDLANTYKDGICLVFRLCVDNYHRYCYPVSGIKNTNTYIKGKLHTVRPIALTNGPVFVENCREYTVIRSEEFGKVLQMEVGAMLVGKIKNHHESGYANKGDEKGMFLYGGSTIIILLEKDRAKIKGDFFSNTEKGIETPVKIGQTLSELNK